MGLEVIPMSIDLQGQPKDIAVTYKAVDSLTAYTRNARTHSKRQIQQIARSIKEFGFTNPILINRDQMIIAGHGRVQAAKTLGINRVPTICLENLTEDQVRAYVIADNKLAENAGWDESILKIELQYLVSLDSLDLTLTGFEVPEIDLLLNDEADEVEEPVNIDDSPAVTQLGDLWQLGPHRILCGSALAEESFDRLMDGQGAQIVFTDPPYNVPINGHATGNGAIQHREFAMASGEMSSEEFSTFLTQSLDLLRANSQEGSIHFVCMDWRHTKELLSAGERVYDSLLNVCVWVKDNGGMGSFYRSRHELVFVFRNGDVSHRNNIQLGKFGRNRTNVWEYPGVSTLSKQGDEGNLLALHPTVKPVALVADALLDCSAPKDIVLDPFLGSGTTLLAAERTGRICRAIELSPKYVDTAIRRWQNRTGQQAIHLASGRTFDSLTTAMEVANA
jgi:DNA modification methylase